MSSWLAKYQALTPKTKALIGFGVMGYAALGLYLSDSAEEKFGMKATEEDKEKLKALIPKVHTIEKGASPLAKDR
ncbi:uncharacterized protein PV09_03278 [Verruconis gallopava]|uniref:Uncharacterized protein n=1 Tax=Verruconis gallopava TaxID=253628 RepID=A0A0D1XTN6_9PEZI|nr:uncharacterized protein PV09_03278 [Verruconis gallopava]KIW06111.1 hypothetical protein PV09_03278 [Verruconis gallopava]